MTEEEFQKFIAIAKVCGTLTSWVRNEYKPLPHELKEIHNTLAAAAGRHNWIQEINDITEKKAIHE